MDASPPRSVRAASDSPALETLARVGFAASGLIHLLIAWIAAQIALGGGGEADQAGALSQLREAPGGSVMLWIAVVGFVALALWQLLEAAVGGGSARDDRERLMERLKSGAKGVVYLALAWTAWTFARGGSTDSGQTSADVTADLMGMPAGRVIVGLVGLAVLAVGGYHIYKGVTRKFTEDLAGGTSGDLGDAVLWLGTIGYIAKGVALAIMGGLFGYAALTSRAKEATGLDGALRTLAEQPFGTVLLLLVAVGLAAYGLYSFARARYARM